MVRPRPATGQFPCPSSGPRSCGTPRRAGAPRRARGAARATMSRKKTVRLARPRGLRNPMAASERTMSEARLVDLAPRDGRERRAVRPVERPGELVGDHLHGVREVERGERRRRGDGDREVAARELGVGEAGLLVAEEHRHRPRPARRPRARRAARGTGRSTCGPAPRRRVVPATRDASPIACSRSVQKSAPSSTSRAWCASTPACSGSIGGPSTTASEVKPMVFMARQAAPTLRGSRGRTSTKRTSGCGFIRTSIVADRRSMKKGLLFFWLAAAATGWTLDWQLPVVTLKGEASGGAARVGRRRGRARAVLAPGHGHPHDPGERRPARPRVGASDGPPRTG